MRRLALHAVVVLSVVGAGCAGGSSSAPAGAAATPAASAAAAPASARVARGSTNVIVNSEIEAAGADIRNAYELVERLRPTMLRPRGVSSSSNAEGSVSGIVVYSEDVRLGDVQQLKTVMRATVYEIRYISATDATTRWGTGHANGVIQIRLKR